MLPSSIKSNFIRKASLIICLVSLLNSPAMGAESSDWRTDYKSMVGAYYTGDYDGAINDARTCLDKVMRVNDQTEKNVALDELIKYLNMIGGRNGRQQNYSQQELLLKCKLKANEARYGDDSANEYRVTQIKKELATCLVLEGKSKEAETYLTKQEKLRKSENLSGWKKDVDLLSEANRGRRVNSQADPDKLCEYATNAVNDALSIKNATEKEVAVSQIVQQLALAQYRYKNDKDYSHEEKILKLQLKIQEKQGAEDDWENWGMGVAYQRTNTLKELVTCLVMEGKDDEAADYNKTYKEEADKMTKNRKKYMKNLIEKATPVIEDKENKSADKKRLKTDLSPPPNCEVAWYIFLRYSGLPNTLL